MSYAVPIAVTPDGDSDVSRYYDQPFVVEDDGLMSCYDHNGDLSSVDGARRVLRIEEREEERDDAYARVGNSCGGRRMYLSFSELIHRV